MSDLVLEKMVAKTLTNPILHNLHKIEIEVGDVGTTVRKGNKWADLVVKGDEINLCECASPCPSPDHVELRDCVIVGVGQIIDVWQGSFNKIPARLVELEHEERSRVYSGLLESMRKAYGSDFAESTKVTVLVYTRIA